MKRRASGPTLPHHRTVGATQTTSSPPSSNGAHLVEQLKHRPRHLPAAALLALLPLAAHGVDLTMGGGVGRKGQQTRRGWKHTRPTSSMKECASPPHPPLSRTSSMKTMAPLPSHCPAPPPCPPHLVNEDDGAPAVLALLLGEVEGVAHHLGAVADEHLRMGGGEEWAWHVPQPQPAATRSAAGARERRGWEALSPPILSRAPARATSPRA